MAKKPKISANEAKDLAMQFYMNGVSIKNISRIVKREVRTIQYWASQEGWNENMKFSYNKAVEREAFINKCEAILIKKVPNGLEKEERVLALITLGDEQAKARGNLDALAKAQKVRSSLPTNLQIINQDMDAIKRFLTYLAYQGDESSLKSAQDLVNHSQEYINSLYRKINGLR